MNDVYNLYKNFHKGKQNYKNFDTCIILNFNLTNTMINIMIKLKYSFTKMYKVMLKIL